MGGPAAALDDQQMHAVGLKTRQAGTGSSKKIVRNQQA
jgi:hypothetical protein